MGKEDSSNEHKLSRRNTILATGTALLGSALPTSAASENGLTTVLGEFESGYDGWKTNGRTDLSLVTREEVPRAAKTGQYALEVDGSTDPAPLIWKDAADADVLGHPYFVADVYVPRIEGYESTVSIELRYHYDRSGGKGRRDSGRPVETLEVKEVPQEYGHRISWDVSELDDWKLKNANKVELVWFRTDSPPKTSARGGGPGDPYGGSVYFDQIWLTDEASSTAEDDYVRHVSELRAEHGRPSYEFDGVVDGIEKGTLVFLDGREVPVETEIVDQDRLRYTVGEETFEFGGGWE